MELSENKLVGPDLVSDAEEKVKLIKERLRIGEKVLRFGKKGKLSPRFIGPYEITERIGPVAYRLALPPELSKIHNVFHVSMLRRYRSDPTHIIQSGTVELDDKLSYEEEPVQILSRETKVLRNKTVPLVKVLWRNHSSEEATWETEESMRVLYPQLFPTAE
ncbi:unnamed protein product [Cuscuta campestris]|uniref:Tf2-1-like SH3-like domain-containing protein n=1 Tax=Cuscuta campestris TaxID=132261 RepID=A0A484MPE4_9ASTE|nr:unnamed protein product [Cuscuta campestris]